MAGVTLGSRGFRARTGVFGGRGAGGVMVRWFWIEVGGVFERDLTRAHFHVYLSVFADVRDFLMYLGYGCTRGRCFRTYFGGFRKCKGKLVGAGL